MPPLPTKSVLTLSSHFVRGATTSTRLRAYLEMAKPGITLMEVITAVVGFIVAQPWQVTHVASVVWRLVGLTAGVFLLGASAGMFNHVFERDSDASMKRTAHRPLPSGRVSLSSAMALAWMLLIIGAGVLWLVDWQVWVLGIATVVLYVLVYTPLKSKTAAALFIGGIPGALPVVGGWVAGGGSIISWEAAILFAIMFWWQLPHFLALALMYADDYRRGGVILLSGGKPTALAWHTMVYAVMLVVSAVGWALLGRSGMLYILGVAIMSGWLIIRCAALIKDRTSKNSRAVLMATYMFLMGVFLLMAIDVQ